METTKQHWFCSCLKLRILWNASNLFVLSGQQTSLSFLCSWAPSLPAVNAGQSAHPLDFQVLVLQWRQWCVSQRTPQWIWGECRSWRWHWTLWLRFARAGTDLYTQKGLVLNPSVTPVFISHSINLSPVSGNCLFALGSYSYISVNIF